MTLQFQRISKFFSTQIYDINLRIPDFFLPLPNPVLFYAVALIHCRRIQIEAYSFL